MLLLLAAAFYTVRSALSFSFSFACSNNKNVQIVVYWNSVRKKGNEKINIIPKNSFWRGTQNEKSNICKH